MSELYTAQRVDNGEWVTGNYIHQYHSYKKGRRINAIVVSNELKSSRYEVLDETLKQIDGKKIKALERQLEEAREEIKENRRDHLKDTRELLGQLDEAREFEKRIKHHCQAYENTGNAWFNMNRIYQEVEQLKEKGCEEPTQKRTRSKTKQNSKKK